MKIKLQEILDNKNISIYSLSKQIGVAQNNLSKLIKGETTSIKYDILENLCNILDITPNDIFEIEPSTDIELKTYRLLNKIRNDENTTKLNNIGKKYTNSFLADIKMFQGQKLYFSNNLDKNDEVSTYDLRTDEDMQELESISQRLALESSIDKLVFEFLNQIMVAFLKSPESDENIKQITQGYNEYDYFKTGLKVKQYYRIFLPFLNTYYNDISLKATLTKINLIYSKGGLETLPEEELRELEKVIKYYLNNPWKVKQKD